MTAFFNTPDRAYTGPAATPSMTKPKPRVLIVDDNDTDNLITRRVIEISGFSDKVDVCNSGKGALEWLESHIGNTERLPDLIFLDINMPIVDGFVFLLEFERMAPQMHKDIQIIVLSSSDSREDIERMQLHPRVSAFITKPLSTARLAALHLAKA